MPDKPRFVERLGAGFCLPARAIRPLAGEDTGHTFVKHLLRLTPRAALYFKKNGLIQIVKAFSVAPRFFRRGVSCSISTNGYFSPPK